MPPPRISRSIGGFQPIGADPIQDALGVIDDAKTERTRTPAGKKDIDQANLAPTIDALEDIGFEGKAKV